MSQHLRSWAPLALTVLALVAGFALARLGRGGGDMLDAVAAVQRKSPRFLVTEPRPPVTWVQTGTVYLCRTPRTADEVEGLSKHPARPDPRWAGVVCFRGTDDPNLRDVPWISDGGDRCLDYGTFAVFGDPELLQEVRALLADAGFRPKG